MMERKKPPVTTWVNMNGVRAITTMDTESKLAEKRNPAHGISAFKSFKKTFNETFHPVNERKKSHR